MRVGGRRAGNGPGIGPGQEGLVVLESTPFYAEAGGQVADRGVIASGDGRATVIDVQRPAGDLVVHRVRVDSGLYAGYRVPPYYDSLVAKLIVHGQTRNECLMRLRRALEDFVVAGVNTTIPLHQRLIGESDFINGDYDIHWLERFVSNLAEGTY